MRTWLLYALGRQMQHWSGVLLRRAAAATAAAAQQRVAANPPDQSDGSPVPPAHWQQYVRSSGPPDHWLTLVRQHAPQLLDPADPSNEWQIAPPSMPDPVHRSATEALAKPQRRKEWRPFRIFASFRPPLRVRSGHGSGHAVREPGRSSVKGSAAMPTLPPSQPPADMRLPRNAQPVAQDVNDEMRLDQQTNTRPPIEHTPIYHVSLPRSHQPARLDPADTRQHASLRRVLSGIPALHVHGRDEHSDVGATSQSAMPTAAQGRTENMFGWYATHGNGRGVRATPRLDGLSTYRTEVLSALQSTIGMLTGTMRVRHANVTSDDHAADSERQSAPPPLTGKVFRQGRAESRPQTVLMRETSARTGRSLSLPMASQRDASQTPAMDRSDLLPSPDADHALPPRQQSGQTAAEPDADPWPTLPAMHQPGEPATDTLPASPDARWVALPDAPVEPAPDAQRMLREQERCQRLSQEQHGWHRW